MTRGGSGRRGGRGRGSRRRGPCCLAASHSLEIGGDFLEALAAGPAAGVCAGLQKIAEGHEVAALAAAVLVALPLLGRVAFLDGEDSVASFLRSPAEEEAPGTGFIADAVQLGKIDAVEAGHLFERDAGHQLVDVDEGLFFGGHGKADRMK